MLANLELLAETLDGDQGDAAASALRSSRRMRRLVADLLLLARADVAPRVGARADRPVARVVVAAAASWSRSRAGHDLTIDVEPITVVGARDDLHRMAFNLMDNAIKHTPAGHARAGPSAPGGRRGGFEVCDDGPGIPEDMRDSIFERFVRGGGEVAGSSGLGLSIVRAVAQSHGGEVTVDEGEDGHGARFVVRIPAADSAVEIEPPAPVLAS